MRNAAFSLYRLAFVATTLAGLGCLPPDKPLPTDGIRVGALLPFTGDLSASGANLERALIMASESINQAGGIGGKSIQLIARDTHSERARGLEVARQLVEEDQVVAMVGPEEADLAAALLPYLRSKGVVEISGGPVAPVSTELVDFWYRIVPSAKVMAASLAQQMRTDGVQRVAIVYVNDAFGSIFADVFLQALLASGGQAAATVNFAPTTTSFGEVIAAAVASKPDAIMLVAYPKIGAAIIQESAFTAQNLRWYLSPSLRTEVFLQNVSPALVEGVIGVSSALPADSGDFAAAYAQRWDGEVPSTNAYFYFDALALFGLAMQAANHAQGGSFDPKTLSPFITQVANPGGTIITWDQLDDGMSSLDRGVDVNYRGVSGSVDFNNFGDVSQGLVQMWTIRSGKIVGNAF